MMEDWTDIIGKELKNIEAPLPADDWSVLQRKYAATQKKTKAAAFAWAGGIMSIAVAIVLVILFSRPETSVSEDVLLVETFSPTMEITPVDSVVVCTPTDTVPNVVHPVQKTVNVSVGAIIKTADDALIAEARSDEVPYENLEEIFDVIRDTVQQTGTFGFEDYPDDEPKRKRRPMSIGLSGAASDSPLMRVYDMAPGSPMDSEPPLTGDWADKDKDSLNVGTSQRAMTMVKKKNAYSDSYSHEIPMSVGVSARFFFTDRLSINTGLIYTRYKSLRTRTFAGTSDRQKDRQYAHYLGVPVRLDYMAVNKKHFNLYFGAGLQMDRCIYAKVGTERLHEKQLLFGVHGTMGVQANIVPMVGLYFEPELSYALNQGTIETFRTDEPFVITVRGGLRFNF